MRRIPPPCTAPARPLFPHPPRACFSVAADVPSLFPARSGAVVVKQHADGGSRSRGSRLNSVLLARTAFVLLALGLAVHFVHRWQMARHARGQLERADQAEKDGDQEELVASLSRYLNFDPESRPVRG